VLPQKVAIDQLYVNQRTLGGDLRILLWTIAAVVLRMEVAVNRRTARLTRRAPRTVPDNAAARVAEPV
jgi:hypothetical protein